MATVGWSNPLRFKRNLRPGIIHPFNDLPIELVAQLRHAGDRPMMYDFEHFTKYTGPIAEGSLGGYTLLGSTGTATISSVVGADGGAIRLSTSAAEDDNAMLRLTDYSTHYSTTKRQVYAVRISLSDADDMEAFVGVSTNVANFVASLPVSGLFFEKGETATNWDFHSRDASTSTENEADFAGLTLVDDTQMTLAIRVESGHVTPYVHTDSTGWVVGTSILSTDSNIVSSSSDLRFHLGIQTGAAATASMDIDWILTVEEL